ncbi:NAD(+) synthase [Psychroflexus sp. ALD_RP9]|uniref:NAD(+) synthase n=1 Tax=Psychroflexus sp. ALD_RP9 TaxID=2777186 RepID=UPI001A8C5AF6|nr:NAD(+) synthase [Psychroflexus sp. ALD_RP9]QSS96494.1 NAD(+) synthase [Psychroflexus sp. ALD_RP9]
MQNEKVINYIKNWLNNYLNKTNAKGFVIGVSGGIDSAVTSTLCAMTKQKVLCVEMPIHQEISQVTRAQKHISWLKLNYKNVSSVKVDLTPTFNVFKDSLPDTNSKREDLALANSRARLRMTTLYYLAGLNNYLVAGTGNKVEDFGVGFYTKYGDGGVDLSPIADLMKSEVFSLAQTLKIIDEIQKAKPTDGLFGDSRSDEDQLGASYDELEWAMQFEGKQEELSSRQAEVLKIYHNLNSANQHKMKPIPICNIPAEFK